MPAPTPGNIELTNVVQLGADSKAQSALSEDEILETLFELARPVAPDNSKPAMCETLAVAARTHDLPVGFFVRLINQESGFNPQAVSPVGAQGVAQFMPKVAEEWNLKNPFNPHEALVASARFLKSLKEQFGNWGLAAAAYNGGMGRVAKWIRKGGKLPDETRHYVKTITGLPAEQWANGKPQQNANFSISKRLPCQEIAHLADMPVEENEVPLPRTRVQLIQAAVPQGGPSPKLALAPAVKTVPATVKITVGKGGTKVAVIKVKKETTKVAAVAAKIDAPASIVAEKAPQKGKGGKDFTKLAEKATKKAAGKSKAAKAEKKPAKGRVQVADASQARK